MSSVDELIHSDPFAEEPDTESNEADIVINISWTYALVSLLVVLGIAGALVAGLWFGHSRATAGTAVQTAQTQAIQPRVVQNVRSQPIRVQPRVIPQSQPGSSADVTMSIGRTPTVGDPAPDFTLKNLEGEEVSLSDFKGRPVLINFWATWCPPCRFEMPAIQKMYAKYQDEGFVVLAVDVEESISAVKRYIEQGGYTFTVLLDYKGEVSNGPYRVRAFPTSYFVDRESKIAVAHRGMVTEPMLQQYMDRVLATE
ncbi:MAG: TlpA family protein disulfide reductase [Anaerolineae bacterium]